MTEYEVVGPNHDSQHDRVRLEPPLGPESLCVLSIDLLALVHSVRRVPDADAAWQEYALAVDDKSVATCRDIAREDVRNRRPDSQSLADHGLEVRKLSSLGGSNNASARARSTVAAHGVVDLALQPEVDAGIRHEVQKGATNGASGGIGARNDLL